MSESDQSAEVPAPDRLRIVIADDVSAMRALLRRVLEDSAAFDVVGEAVDGEEAVRMAGAFLPDVVLLDLAMPVMGGLEAIPDIRLSSPTSRIVVLSSVDPGPVRQQALALGADAFIEKRVVSESLAERLVAACRRPRRVDPGEAVTDDVDPWAEVGRPGQEWFRPTFDHSPIGMALVDLHGRFQMVNDAFCRILVRPVAELVGTGVDVVSHPGDVDRHTGLRRRLLAEDRPWFQDEHRFVRSDGHIAWTVLTWSLLRDDDGSPGPFLCQALDVTDRKVSEVASARAEDLRERYEKELARSNAELAEFATVAAHDLKSPLQVIAGFAGLLEQTSGEALDERGQEFLGYITRSADRMNVLIDDLLAYAKVGAERQAHATVALDRVVDEVTESLESEIGASGGSVEHEALPVVTGDPKLFVHLLHDLVTNGLKFVTPGTPPRVVVSASRMINAWCIDVADNGIGIEPRHRSHIFGMFQRLHRNDYEGTGIGLAICKRIVEQRGGSLWVEENAGGGSRFRFTVPDEVGAPRVEALTADAGPGVTGAADSTSSAGSVGSAGPYPAASVVHSSPTTAVAPVPPAPGQPDPGGSFDLLLVEDDDDHARLVEEILASADGAYHLRRARDLAGARTELDQRPTDCILLDLFLPDGHGLDSLAHMTALDSMVPIVILTSLADEQLGLEAVHQGAQDYLVKGSVDGHRLSRAVRHAIERKALEARFAEQALHDPLTGLANRTLLLDRIRLELARAGRTGAGVALLYLDVDDFKAINDRWGHDAGDEVLVRMARRLSRAVRPGDTVGRIGGDEFVVVCGGLDSDDDLTQIRTRIEEAVARPMLLGGGTELVTASVGLTIGRGTAEEPEAIIRRADEAMYEAKRRRRG